MLAPIVLEKSGYLEVMQKLATETSQEEMMSLMMEHMNGLLLFGCYSLGLMLIAVAGFVLLIINRKKITFAQAEEPVEKGFRTVFLNPGVLLFAILNLGLVIWQLVM